MELQSYLQSTYEDHILLCLACEEVLTSVSLGVIPLRMAAPLTALLSFRALLAAPSSAMCAYIDIACCSGKGDCRATRGARKFARTVSKHGKRCQWEKPCWQREQRTEMEQMGNNVRY